MQNGSIDHQEQISAIQARSPKRRANAPTVRVCLGADLPSTGLIGHAQLVARSLGGDVVLVHVLEAPISDTTPLDPVDWDIQRREARSILEKLAKRVAGSEGGVGTELLEGRLVDQIFACTARKPRDITTVFRAPIGAQWSISDPARSLIESQIGSVLMVPSDSPVLNQQRYDKIMVPLDGSPRAESAVPNVVRLAKANDAEIILCHIAPEPQITQLGQASSKTIEMRNQAVQQNKRAGGEYLRRIQARLQDCGLRVKTVIADGGDVRRGLLQVITDQHADLVVIASHGQSNHPDVPTGDIANFVMGRSPVPVLMVRSSNRSQKNHIFDKAASTGVRQPADVHK